MTRKFIAKVSRRREPPPTEPEEGWHQGPLAPPHETHHPKGFFVLRVPVPDNAKEGDLLSCHITHAGQNIIVKVPHERHHRATEQHGKVVHNIFHLNHQNVVITKVKCLLAIDN